MHTGFRAPIWARFRDLAPAFLAWLGIALLVAFPRPLELVARFYHAVREPFPILAAVGQLVPPRSLRLLLVLVATVAGVGLGKGVIHLIGTLRFIRQLENASCPGPAPLMESARRLGIADRLTYLALPAPAAFCYGFLRPRIAITAALANRLGAEELTAVLLHERHHLQRRDPLRYLALSALTAGAFLVPLAPFLRRWAEARIELAADRAALTLVPREVLARALAATLLTATGLSAGMAGLSATEARIAHLAGRPELPAFPLMAGLATIALASSLGAAAAAVHGLTRRESPVTASSRP